MTDQCTVDIEAIPAPVSPPISACEDEDGSPFHQVIRFQVIAPSRPESTTRPLGPSVVSTIPDPMVSATPVPSSAPTRFISAAISSAARGVRARVDTEVAIAFAASWKPLV